jgi:hypothetical protein
VNTKTIFDPETDTDVMALLDLKPEMRSLVEALLEHVDDGSGKPLCGAKKFERDLLVGAGLASDCEPCRGKVIVGNLKDHPQRDVKEWEPSPMEGAETMLAEKQKRSDGR